MFGKLLFPVISWHILQCYWPCCHVPNQLQAREIGWKIRCEIPSLRRETPSYLKQCCFSLATAKVTWLTPGRRFAEWRLIISSSLCMLIVDFITSFLLCSQSIDAYVFETVLIFDNVRLHLVKVTLTIISRMIYTAHPEVNLFSFFFFGPQNPCAKVLVLTTDIHSRKSCFWRIYTGVLKLVNQAVIGEILSTVPPFFLEVQWIIKYIIFVVVFV